MILAKALLLILALLLVLIAITALQFVFRIGGHTRPMAMVTSFLFFLMPFFCFGSVNITALIVALTLATCTTTNFFLRLCNELFQKFALILDAKTICGLPGKLAMLKAITSLNVQFLLQSSQHKEMSGSRRIFGLTIAFPNFRHFHALIDEIYVSREYAVLDLPKQPFIIDCGANIGLATLFFKQLYPQARILCFEPDQESFYYLEKNIKENHLTQVTLKQTALAEKNGTVAFATGFHTEGSTTFLKQGNGIIEVAAQRLSSQFDQQVDLLKIDVEGAEAEIISDLFESKKIHLVRNIIVEWHYMPSNPNGLEHVLALLHKKGFSYDVRCFTNPRIPYTAHEGQAKKIYTLMIFASNSKNQPEDVNNA